MEPINVGIIGAGGIAYKMHLPQIAKMEQMRVTWLCGRDRARLTSLAGMFDVPRWTEDYQEVLADPSVDAVIIALPHPLHVPVGLDALKAGKHLMVQKPLTGDMTEADSFVAAVEGSRSIVLCLPHFAPEVYKAREMVTRGQIGRVSGIHCRTSHGGPEVYYAEVQDALGQADPDLWFFDPQRATVGALFDMGVYAASTMVAVLGSVVRVMGMTATLAKPTSLEDTASLLLQFESGALGTLETGWCDPARTWALRVHGTQGKLTLPGPRGEPMAHWVPTSYTREDAAPTITAVEASSESRGNAHEHFAQCIRDGTQPPLSNVQLARHVTEVLLAGLGSAQVGEAVDVLSRVAPAA